MQITSEKLLNVFYEFLFLIGEISVLFILISGILGWVNSKINFNKYLKNDFLSYLKAIAIGSLTPFCSCSTIPLFKSMLNANINLSICFAYLLTSPLINPMIFTLLLSIFGLKITIFYIAFIVIFVLIVSLLISRLDSSKLLIMQNINNSSKTKQNQGFLRHMYLAFLEYKRLFPYVFIGMAFGAFLHNFIPQDFLATRLNNAGIISIFIASLIGILLYIRTSLIIPIGFSLVSLGVPLGTVFSFLIAGGGCSLPELIMLKSMFKTPLMLIFVLSVLAMANIFGILLYIFY